MSFDSDISEDTSIREGKHPTGVKILDEEELRGIPKGTTIAVIGEPDSAAELLLHSLAATGRNTEYITTLRSSKGLKDDIKRARLEDKVTEKQIDENLSIRDVYTATDDLKDLIPKSASRVNDGNLIIDSFSNIDDDKKINFARQIHSKTKKNSGLTYLYFVASDTSELSKNEREILQLVDGVFNVKKSIFGEDNIENYLYINKLRGIKVPGRAQNLIFGEKLGIDTTTDIG